MSTDAPGRTPGVPVAVVPTAPLLLPSVSPRQPAESADAVASLRAAVTATLEALPDAPLLIAVAGGPRTAVHLGNRVDRTGSGHPQAVATVPGDQDAAIELAERAGLHVVADEILAGDLGVLAALIAAVHPTTPVVGVTVTSATDLPAVGRDLGAWAASRDAVVVVAGDLAATRELTSPGYLVEGATDFDQTVVDALRAGDATAVAALGADEARRVEARGWAALVIGAQVADAPFVEVELVAPRGVGQLVARTEPA